MNMNESENKYPELDALFAQARARRVDTSAAEYAFETRLMARLRAERDTDSVWARVSWRMLPFFALCVLGLTFWHGEVLSEVQDAQQLSYVENPVATDGWESQD
jgi:hypothetical protein